MNHQQDAGNRNNEWNIFNRNVIFAVTLAIFMNLVFLFQNAQPIGNNYDHNNYFAFILILPAIGVLFTIIILQTKINSRTLLYTNIIFEIIMLFWVAIITINFEMYNGDNPMYIYGYLMVYNSNVFITMISGVISLIYLAFIDRLIQFRKGKLELKLQLMDLTTQFVIGAAISLTTLLISKFISIGFGFMFLGLAVGITSIIKKDGSRTFIESTDEAKSIIKIEERKDCRLWIYSPQE